MSSRWDAISNATEIGCSHVCDRCQHDEATTWTEHKGLRVPVSLIVDTDHADHGTDALVCPVPDCGEVNLYDQGSSVEEHEQGNTVSAEYWCPVGHRFQVVVKNIKGIVHMYAEVIA